MNRINSLTFYDWCMNNNRNDLVKLWCYDLNSLYPNNIAYRSNKKIFLSCNKLCGNLIEISLNNLVRNVNYIPICKKCNSFAQYGIDNFGNNFLDNYWDYSKNIKSPWNIQKSSKEYLFLYCQNKNYHGSYKISANNFHKGKRCSYCHMFKIHPIDSFAEYHINNTDEDFIHKYWGDKNILNPFEIGPHSRQSVWIKCQDIDVHGEYFIRTADFTSRKRCPLCVIERKESFLQEKVRTYIHDVLKYDLNHEHRCSIIAINPLTGCKLPYDNEIVDLKCLVETMGCQHEIVSFFHKQTAKKNNTTSEYELKMLQWRDEYKKQFALDSGYHYLAVPYTAEKSCEYKTLIDNKIKEILQAQKPTSSTS